MTIPRMTSLIPGHNPPQVTIAQEEFAGSKKSFRRGPANSKAVGVSLRAIEVATLVNESFRPHAFCFALLESSIWESGRHFCSGCRNYCLEGVP